MNATTPPEEAAAAGDRLVGELRAEISALDRELLATVNRRLEIVARLHAHKQAHGMPLRDPEREASLLAALRAANRGPLSTGGLNAFFEHLLALVRRELHGENGDA